VTELFVCATQAADSLSAEGWAPEWYRDRLDRMLAFVRDYTRPDGLAPLIGDADDGRFLPLGGYGRDPRDHRHLFAQAGRSYSPATESAAYPDGGYFILRRDDLYAVIRCGDVGRYGHGGHGHNDQLSFELSAGGRALVIDPGSYVYTSRPAERNRFRSTAYHSTLSLDGREQNELRTDDLFSMEDRTQAEATAWDETSFEGRHHGFPGATHSRRIEIVADGLVITDTIDSKVGHEVEWTFPLAPGAERHVEIRAEGLELRPEEGWYAPRYGVREQTSFLRGRRRSQPGRDVTEIRVRALA
jgi:hypothetical protein